MLRIVDAPAAVAQRGFSTGVSAEAGFVLDDPEVADNCGAWRLRVAGGRGSLERQQGAADLPRLHVRGLALLYAGVADTAALVRAGLLDRALTELDPAFAGHEPRILDYF
jgi:predicted acetyltransferase